MEELLKTTNALLVDVRTESVSLACLLYRILCVCVCTRCIIGTGTPQTGSWPSGSHRATTPLPGWSWGSEPGSGLNCISHWSRGNTGTHPWPAPWASPMGSNPTRGRQCGHTGSTGRPGKNGETPLQTHTHTHKHAYTQHTHTHTHKHANTHTHTHTYTHKHAHTHTHTERERERERTQVDRDRENERGKMCEMCAMCGMGRHHSFVMGSWGKPCACLCVYVAGF